MTLRIGVHCVGPARAVVSLVLDPRQPSAFLHVAHSDREGCFVETRDLSHLLDRVGESAVDHGLAAIELESGTPADIRILEDLACALPQFLDT